MGEILGRNNDSTPKIGGETMGEEDNHQNMGVNLFFHIVLSTNSDKNSEDLWRDEISTGDNF